MTYLDEAFQKVTDRPCADCKFYFPHENILFAQCNHVEALSKITRIFMFAAEMRNGEDRCGLKGKLWQTE